MISFIYVSRRFGGIDLLAYWLAGQSCADEDHELVVVDGLATRAKAGRAERYLYEQKLPLAWYGEPKPRPFVWSRGGYANAVNTGLMRAHGDKFVIIHDFILAPRDSVAVWSKVIRESDGRTLIGADRTVCSAEDPAGFDEVMTWIGGTPAELKVVGKAPGFGLGYWGGPTALMEECNGLDERTDLGHGWAINDLVAKATRLGWGLQGEPTLTYYAIDHAAWGPPGVWETEYRPAKVNDVPYEPEWTGWSANPYVLAEERRKNCG